MRLIRCISASAGTGKTHKINSLIQSLVQSGVNPSSILCITFTKQAANEMEKRYCSYTNQSTTSKPYFKTIHGFAKLLLEKEITIIEEEEQEEIIKEAVEIVSSDKKWSDFFESSEYEFANIISDAKYIISNQVLNSEKIDIAKMLEKISFQKIELSQKCQEDLMEAKLKNLLQKIMSNDYSVYQNEIVTKNHRINKKLIPDSFLNNPKYSQSNKEIQKVLKTILNFIVNTENNQYVRESTMINLFLKRICEEYTFIKEVRGLFDYTDLISSSLQDLNLEKIMNFSHIFLDEAQDTNPHQWNFIISFVEEIFQKDDTSFTMVADEKQIIYQFNNSSESYYNKAKTRLKKIVTELNGKWIDENLNKSYRSPKLILDFVDSIMNNTKYPTKHEPAYPKNGYIKIWDQEEAHAKITSQDWQIQEKPKAPIWIQKCIEQVKDLFGKKLLNENRLISYSDMTILISKRCLNTFIMAEEIRKAGIPIKESPFYLIQREILQELISIAELSLNIETDLNLIIILRGPFFKFSYSDIEEICVDRETSVLDRILTITTPKIQKAGERIKKWMSFPKDILGFFSNLLLHDEYGLEIQKKFYDEILLFWETLLDFCGRSSSLSEFITYFKNLKRGFSSNTDGISISTIHSSKGTENHIIFVCTSQSVSKKQNSFNLMHNNILLLKGNYKLYKQAKTKEILSKEIESDRLLYVALTRAKEQIYILPPGESQKENSWYTKLLEVVQSSFVKKDSFYEFLDIVDVKKRIKG